MRKIVTFIFCVNMLLVTSGNTVLFGQSRKLKLAVLELKGKDIAQKYVSGVGDLLRLAMDNTGAVEVMDYDDMVKIFKKAEIADAACNEPECAIKYGKILNVDMAVIALVSRSGGTLIVTPKIVNVKKEKLEFEDKPCFISMSALDSGAEDLAKRLVKKIMISEGNETTSVASENKSSPQAKDKVISTGKLASELVWEKDNSPMILVNAGEFLMGIPESELPPKPKNAKPESKEDKKPANMEHKEFVDAYYIDKYEVTNERFAKFINAYGKDTDESGNKLVYPDDLGLAFDYGKWKPAQEQYRKYPVTGVTWFGAYKYAEWAGKQLPTEAQWEKAARGGDGRVYPWGFTPDKKKCNYAGEQDGYVSVSPVGSFPDGKSPYGCMDMAGNAWEWTCDLIGKSGGGLGGESSHGQTSSSSSEFKKPTEKDAIVLKGGSCDGDIKFCRPFVRVGALPTAHNTAKIKAGFRCIVPVSKIR